VHALVTGAAVIDARVDAVLRARLSDGIRPDTVFAPFHWPGVNALTNPALDPHSRMPAFKVCAVAITRHEKGTD